MAAIRKSHSNPLLGRLDNDKERKKSEPTSLNAWQTVLFGRNAGQPAAHEPSAVTITASSLVMTPGTMRGPGVGSASIGSTIVRGRRREAGRAPHRRKPQACTPPLQTRRMPSLQRRGSTSGSTLCQSCSSWAHWLVIFG